MADFDLKVGDLEPPVMVTLIDTTGVPVDLSTALSVVFKMAPTDTRVELFARAASIDSAPDGELSYIWQAGDTDIADVYYCEFTVAWPGPRDQTFPSEGYLTVSIEPTL